MLHLLPSTPLRSGRLPPDLIPAFHRFMLNRSPECVCFGLKREMVFSFCSPSPTAARRRSGKGLGEEGKSASSCLPPRSATTITPTHVQGSLCYELGLAVGDRGHLWASEAAQAGPVVKTVADQPGCVGLCELSDLPDVCLPLAPDPAELERRGQMEHAQKPLPAPTRACRNLRKLGMVKVPTLSQLWPLPYWPSPYASCLPGFSLDSI